MTKSRSPHRMPPIDRNDGSKIFEDPENMEDFNRGFLSVPVDFYKETIRRIKSLEQRIAILEQRP